MKNFSGVCKRFPYLREPFQVDENGYWRDASGDLVHRQIAFHEIFLPNRAEYPEGFSNYIVHHKNENKLNFRPENLEILLREEHNAIHGLSDNVIHDLSNNVRPLWLKVLVWFLIFIVFLLIFRSLI